MSTLFVHNSSKQFLGNVYASKNGYTFEHKLEQLFPKKAFSNMKKLKNYILTNFGECTYKKLTDFCNFHARK